MTFYNRILETGFLSVFIVISIFYFNMKESRTTASQTETESEMSPTQNLIEEKKEEIEKEYKNLFKK